MHVDDLRRIQREAATANLYGLVVSCRGRFVEAADLLEWRSAAIERLREAGVVERIDLWPLYAAYTVLSERYIAEFFSPQEALFFDPTEMQDAKWSSYFHHCLVPQLLRNHDVVRNVLRSVRLLPCNDPQAAATSLSQCFTEVALPQTAPAWAPEDMRNV